jgi:hypothetical protein
VHICLEKRSTTSGVYIPIVCNNPGSYIKTTTRAAIVTWPCNNTLSVRYSWQAIGWLTVMVDGKVFGQDTVLGSFDGNLFCK